MKTDGKEDKDIQELWGEQPFLNRFRVSPKAIDVDGKQKERYPVGFYYGRMGAKTYK
eukprot:TRINITY_DN10492_c0_g1_i1.p3 TRINITY_DN10492_c0_g1~~TRINITY_DN10492_c0_g1_i1.p3  ORF type:complete len:57 (-),score=10.50 TRINITY_DN10492_c0_g1_i1:230-400(-)